MARRYDSDEYLRAYKARRVYPAIHDDIWTAIVENATGTSFCDTCCSTGLLGQRLLDRFPGVTSVCGIEMDADAVTAGRAHGVSYEVLQARIDHESLPSIRAWWRRFNVTVLVARRCFSEIFGYSPAFGPLFTHALLECGIGEVFLQGRAESSRSTHPMPNVRKELAVLMPSFRLVFVHGQVVYLRRA